MLSSDNDPIQFNGAMSGTTFSRSTPSAAIVPLRRSGPRSKRGGLDDSDRRAACLTQCDVDFQKLEHGGNLRGRGGRQRDRKSKPLAVFVAMLFPARVPPARSRLLFLTARWSRGQTAAPAGAS